MRESTTDGTEAGQGSTQPDFLKVAGLHAGYGQARVLQGLDFCVARGEVCAILGPNGAGKTTILRALCGHGPRTRLGDV